MATPGGIASDTVQAWLQMISQPHELSFREEHMEGEGNFTAGQPTTEELGGFPEPASQLSK